MAVHVDVRVPASLEDEDSEAILEDVRALDLEPTLMRSPAIRGPETWTDSWIYILAVEPFVQKLVEKAAGDAYRRLKGLLGRSTARAGGARTVLLQQGELQIALEADLPDSAYDQLSTMDLPRTGRLYYDRNWGTWAVQDGSPP